MYTSSPQQWFKLAWNTLGCLYLTLWMCRHSFFKFFDLLVYEPSNKFAEVSCVVSTDVIWSFDEKSANAASTNTHQPYSVSLRPVHDTESHYKSPPRICSITTSDTTIKRGSQTKARCSKISKECSETTQEMSNWWMQCHSPRIFALVRAFAMWRFFIMSSTFISSKYTYLLSFIANEYLFCNV